MTTLFFRKQNPTYHSIEGLFEPLVKTQKGTHKIALIKMPLESNSILNLVRNFFFSRQHSTEVNHITGDIHYAILGLSRNSFNILTIHDCIVLDRTPPYHPKYWFYKWFWYDFPIRKADVVTVISEKTKKEILDLFPWAKDKIIVIPNYVNRDFSYEPKMFNTQYPVILQIGSNPNKNRERLLLALKGIKCHIDFIGELSESDIQQLDENKITYTSKINLPLEAVIEAYKKADIVYFASTYEGFGMPIIEAQATGRVVITSNISPMVEHAGEGAIIVDPYSVESIRNGILEILSNPNLRETTIQKGLENVKKYTFERFTDSFTKLYHASPQNPNHSRLVRPRL